MMGKKNIDTRDDWNLAVGKKHTMTNIALKCCQFHHFSTNNSFYQYSSYGSCFPQFWKMFPPHKAEESKAPWPSGPFLQTFLFYINCPTKNYIIRGRPMGDILKLKLGLICTIVITSPQMAIEVLKRHHQVFASCLLPIAAHSISFQWPWCKMGVSSGHYWQCVGQKLKVSGLLCAN